MSINNIPKRIRKSDRAVENLTEAMGLIQAMGFTPNSPFDLSHASAWAVDILVKLKLIETWVTFRPHTTEELDEIGVDEEDRESFDKLKHHWGIIRSQ